MVGAYYLLLELPHYGDRTGEGTGKGPGIGYEIGEGGGAGYVTADGDDWLTLHESVGLLANAVFQVGKPIAEQPTEKKYATELRGVHPNPSNPKSELEFSLAREAHVNLRVYDLRGRLVRTLLSDAYFGAS